jgi:type VI secretion system secreted protein VgrG
VSWQEKRTVAVATPLGDDVLLFRRMVATEQLSRPFAFDLELLSENHGISPESILGQSITVRLDLPNGEVRHFNGLASQFAYQGTQGRYASYRCRLSPWLWFLTRTSNCRIFQNKTVPEILKAVFQDRGFSDFDAGKLTASYRQWVYCVQYRETDFNFVSRLMEEEGISYFFRHEDGKHTVMLADDNANLDTLPDYDTIPFYPPEDAQFRERDHISQWIVGHEVQPGALVLRDFDFEKPSANLETRLTQPCGHALSRFEVYDYPGAYTSKADGDTLSRLRLEQSHVGYERAQGSGDVAGLAPGYLFTLTNHPRSDQNRDYVIEATTLEIVSEAYESGAAAAELSCRCTLTAMDRSRSYRPPRITAKPTVHGPQTAIVTGPAGEEIWTDKYGRVKVQFHWDREGQRDENSSCWVRVSHPWAGKGWGAVSIPRIGQEVIVDFLEGDPDQPIVTGRVYNAETTPPYGLPAAAVISGLKSNSTKGGGGYNEYVMDDTKGNELIREHAQYDKDSTIEHDLREHVLNSRFRDVTVDETIDIGHDQTYAIVNNQTGSVGVNKTLTVGANHTESIGSNMTITVASMLTETVGINYAETVGAAMELTVGALMTETVGAAKIQTIGASKVETIGGSKNVKISNNKSEDVGGGKSVAVAKDLGETISGKHTEAVTKEYSLSAKTVTVTAEDAITIKTGSASIQMKKNGDITIEGKLITIKGSGNVVLKGQKILQN